MSAISATEVATGVPRLRTKIAAIAVVLALAGLAAYSMFSGPTTVPAQNGAAKAAPTRAAPAGEEGYPEREGGRGD
jgi:hypothetical protein